MTNAIPILQLAAKHAGYELSGPELAAALTMAGTLAAAVTHATHMALNGWRRVGGWDGFKTFFRTGK